MRLVIFPARPGVMCVEEGDRMNISPGGAVMTGPADQASQGAREAVEQLFITSYLDLVRLAAAVLRDQVMAEDVVQEAFARVQARWHGVRDTTRTLAYLRRAVLNGARSELRRRGVRRPNKLTHPDPKPVPSAEASALGRLGRSELLNAIGNLPNRQRNVLLLRFVQELSISETATSLRITTGAVKASQHRAIENLQRQIGKEI